MSAVARTLGGGVLLGLLVGGVVAAWTWATDRPECSGEMFACAGETLLVAVVGVPLAILLGWLGMRALGVRRAFLAVALTALVALALPALLDPPLVVWPVLIGAVGALSVALLERSA